MERSWEYAVVLDFWTFKDSSERKIGAAFLDTLRKFEFEPKKFGDQDPPKSRFDPDSTQEVLREWVTHPSQLIFERLGEDGFQALLHLSQSHNRPTLITFAVRDHYFTSDERVSKFLDFAQELYRIFTPFYGYIAHIKDLDSKTVVPRPVKVGERTVVSEVHLAVNPTKGLPGIFWANFLGPQFVSFFSDNKLRGAPAYKTTMLDDGGYLVLTSRGPLDYPKRETRSVEQEMQDYLGRDAVFDKSDPERQLRTPFPSKEVIIPESDNPKRLHWNNSTHNGLDQCPECGETKRIDKISRDRANNLKNFKCLSCGALWIVHGSLM